MKLPNLPYFNAGVLLIDTAAFDAARVARALRRLRGGASRRAMLHMDQDVLNGALMGEWAELSPVWNWQYTRATMLFEAMEGANVVHFIGAKKPWTHAGGQLAAAVSERPIGRSSRGSIPSGRRSPEGLAPHRDRRYLRDVLVRHTLAVGRFCDYLDRFESDLTVLNAR